MSAPVHAQVDSISVNAGPAASFQYGEEEPGIIKRSFKRVFEHYVENNMTAAGYTEFLDGSQQVEHWQLDEGWHLIPYWNPAMAMTQTDLTQLHALGEGIRIDRMGFRIINAQMFRTDITAITGVTELSNTFLDKPWWETFVDSAHNFDGLVVAANTAIGTPNTPGYLVMISNDNMKAQEVPNFATGLLPRVKWSYARTGTAPYSKMTQDRYRERSGTGDSAFGSHSTLNCAARRAMGTDQLASHGTEWVNKDPHAWYPFNMPQDNSIWTALKGYVDGINAVFPSVRTNVLNGGANGDSVGVVRRGNNLQNMKHNRWAKMDLDTLTPLGQQDNPPDSFIKIQRMHDVASPMRLAGRILVEYYCDVSLMPSADLFMGAHNFSGGSGAVTIENRTTVNERTNGPLRRWRVWGIPAIPVTATGALLSGTIHYPPWTNFIDNNGNPMVLAGFTQDWPNDDYPNGLFFKPPLELATIKLGVSQTLNTLFCLTVSWDGDPPEVEDETIDSRRINNVVQPALIAKTTVSGIPPLVWVMEAVVDSVDADVLHIASNPLNYWIGPATPASNLLHLLADPQNEAMDVSACSLARKRRREEQLREEEDGSD